MRLAVCVVALSVIAVPVPSVSGNLGATDIVAQARSTVGGQSGGFGSTRRQPSLRLKTGSRYRSYNRVQRPRSRLSENAVGYRPKPKPEFPKRRPFFGTFCCDFTERRETIVVVQPPPVAPPEPPEVVEVDPPPPPDPRGPRFERARGPGRIAQDFEIGARVPRRQPIVALDWRQFDLPEPESGTGYYRIGREVLVLDVYTREILQIATPG
ncbi:MAG: hypothetical protein AAGC81_17950 [Pseudomonadota bacterium]